MIVVNTPSRYGAVAMSLHWLIAAALLINIALGLYVAEIMADSDPMHGPALQFHKSVGLTVLSLSVLRVAWRLVNPAPPLPQAISPGIKRLAHISHFLLYVLILVIPLTGWAMVSAARSGTPTNYFGLLLWPNLPGFANLATPEKSSLHHDFNMAHLYLALSALVLVPIHIAGALYHRGREDDVLSRMVPWARRTPVATELKR
ncbi:MAG TPA: cytochrome b [Rhizomicrobium sp.]|jgi:cytochrome b561|nr:cytochrome b [Rhizomicrobium sp.]